MAASLIARIDKDGERWLMLGFYALIVAVIAVEVFRRFVLSYSSVWGEEVARDVATMRMQAVDWVQETAARLGIDCAFERRTLHSGVAGDDPPPTARALTALAEAWRPWRAYAAIHLWRAATPRTPA